LAGGERSTAIARATALPRFDFSRSGTKFRIYAQQKSAGFTAEVVRIRSAPGTVRPGPRDAAIHVVDARNKASYRDDETDAVRGRPPFRGGHYRPVRPGRDGHFDYLDPLHRQFSAASAFAVTRCTLEIWRHYLERPLPWHFRKTFGPSLELIPRVKSYNSWSGDGYLEFGFPDYPDSQGADPFSENFDAVAHETGHLIMKSVVGTMPDDEKSMQYRAHEEAAADLVAVVAALHFDSVVEHVLGETRGHLFMENVASRVAEWGPRRDQDVRTIFNDDTLASVRRSRTLNKHELSRPFSGAAYDVFVGIYQTKLVALGAIPSDLARRSRHVPGRPVERLRDEFARHLGSRPGDFVAAIAAARHDFARLLARAWKTTPMRLLSYVRVVASLIVADRSLYGGAYTPLIRRAFAARGIEPEPGA
jgi:hypothetical protein